jgi:glutathione S-transferase
MARATLYGTPGSHPSLSAELMLRHKGVDYRRHDLPNMTHKHLLPLLRYDGSTVPVMKLDGRKISGTKAIARALEAVQPQPPILPVDEAVEAWADDVLQDCVRMLGRWAATRDRASMATFVEGAKLGLPVGVVKATLPLIGPLTARQMRVGDDVAREHLQALPGHLDRVDALIAAGQIGGAQLNVLDFQIAPSVRLAMAFDQLRRHVAQRPAGVHALRVAPQYPGRFGPVLPEAWMPFSAASATA